MCLNRSNTAINAFTHASLNSDYLGFHRVQIVSFGIIITLCVL